MYTQTIDFFFLRNRIFEKKPIKIPIVLFFFCNGNFSGFLLIISQLKCTKKTIAKKKQNDRDLNRLFSKIQSSYLLQNKMQGGGKLDFSKKPIKIPIVLFFFAMVNFWFFY